MCGEPLGRLLKLFEVLGKDRRARLCCLLFLLGCGKHLPAEDGIDAGLVALALGFEPVEHVGIDAGGDLALDRPVEHTSAGVLELVFGEGGDIAVVDLALGPGTARAFRWASWASERGGRVSRVWLTVFVFIEPPFLAICTPCGDDADHRFRLILFVNGMGHHDQQHTVHDPKGLPALLSVLDPVLNRYLQGIAEDLAASSKLNPCLRWFAWFLASSHSNRIACTSNCSCICVVTDCGFDASQPESSLPFPLEGRTARSSVMRKCSRRQSCTMPLPWKLHRLPEISLRSR